MKYKDYYAVLDIPRDADLDQIKKAYRKLARQHHPDVSKAADAESKFKEAAEAYATLKSPEKRAAYDALGSQRAGEEFAPPPQWQQSYAAGGEPFSDIDLADLLAAFGRADRGGSPGGRSAHRFGPIAGRDYETSVAIDLQDALGGSKIMLDLNDGNADRTLEVSIPAGASEGQKLRLRGKGGKGLDGGADGDIYLQIKLKPHPIFRVDGLDVYFDLVLSPWEAALGTELEVATLEAPVVLSVPPGSQSGRKLRLRGRGLGGGMQAGRAKPRGNLIAVVQIDVPAALSDEERTLFQQLSAASQFNPRTPTTKEKSHASAARPVG